MPCSYFGETKDLSKVLRWLLMEICQSIQQSVQLLEVMIVRHASPHVLPDIFMGVEVRHMGRQLFNLDLMSARFRRPTSNLRAAGFVIINEQNHHALGVSLQLICPGDGGQRSPKVDNVATAMNHIDCPASDGINGSPVPALRHSHPDVRMTRCFQTRI